MTELGVADAPAQVFESEVSEGKKQGEWRILSRGSRKGSNIQFSRAAQPVVPAGVSSACSWQGLELRCSACNGPEAAGASWESSPTLRCQPGFCLCHLSCSYQLSTSGSSGFLIILWAGQYPFNQFILFHLPRGNIYFSATKNPDYYDNPTLLFYRWNLKWEAKSHSS